MQNSAWKLIFLLVSLVTTCRAATWEASCTMSAVDGEAIAGTVSFTQEDTSNTVNVTVDLTGFNETVNTTHGFHIHEGESIGQNCDGVGFHFDGEPDRNYTHGGLDDDMRHVGDLGNVEAVNGIVSKTLEDSEISLNSSSNNYIVGRTVVIHQNQDDLGDGDNPLSNVTGNAGAKIGCCVIELRTAGARSITFSVAALCLPVLSVFKWQMM